MPRSSKLSRYPLRRPVPTATNTSWPIQSSGPYIIASPIACVLAVPYPYTLPAAHREAVKRRQARYKLPQLAHHVDRHAFELPLAGVGDVLLLRYGVLPGPHPEARGEEEVVVLAFLGSTICSIVKPGALCTFPPPKSRPAFPFPLPTALGCLGCGRAKAQRDDRSDSFPRQRALHCAPLPNTSALRIYYPVIPMKILPGGEILGSRLEHPRPVAFLCQHPRRTNGHLVYYLGFGELAVEVCLPDALHAEVRQIVYAFREHEPSPPKDSPPQSLCRLS